MSSVWGQFRRNRPALGGLVILSGILSLALAAPLIRPGDPWAEVARPDLWPGEDWRFPLGSDVLGRDLLSGILHGARVSLSIGCAAAVTACLLGAVVGAVAGYYGEWVDEALMRLAESFQTIPSFLMAILIVALFAPSPTTIILAIAAVSWPGVARLVRADTLRLKGADFVLACKSYGMSDARIIATQILPNCLAPLIVTTSVMVASAILIEAGLSFLGLGDPSQMSWGSMIAIGRSTLRSDWYMSAIPGVAILVTVMAINLIGDGLNDALNPYLRERTA